MNRRWRARAQEALLAGEAHRGVANTLAAFSEGRTVTVERLYPEERPYLIVKLLAAPRFCQKRPISDAMLTKGQRF